MLDCQFLQDLPCVFLTAFVLGPFCCPLKLVFWTLSPVKMYSYIIILLFIFCLGQFTTLTHNTQEITQPWALNIRFILFNLSGLLCLLISRFCFSFKLLLFQGGIVHTLLSLAFHSLSCSFLDSFGFVKFWR